MEAENLINIMNNFLNINSYRNLVCLDKDNIFSDEFWDNLNIIFNTVDNMIQIIYINEKVATKNIK